VRRLVRLGAVEQDLQCAGGAERSGEKNHRVIGADESILPRYLKSWDDICPRNSGLQSGEADDVDVAGIIRYPKTPTELLINHDRPT